MEQDVPTSTIRTYQYDLQSLRTIELTNFEEENLGILIEPAQVRLQTEKTNDPYIWDRLEEKEHLFSKNISDHSVGGLIELTEGLGKFFSAIPKTTTCRLENGGVLSKAPVMTFRSLSQPS